MFPENERGIFQFFDGSKTVYRDPVVMLRRLNAVISPEELEQLRVVLEAANSPTQPMTPENNKILDQTVEHSAPLIREAFDIPPLSEDGTSGLTEYESIGVLNDFLNWLIKKKATTATTPSSSPSTGSGLQDSPTTTTATSASG